MRAETTIIPAFLQGSGLDATVCLFVSANPEALFCELAIEKFKEKMMLAAVLLKPRRTFRHSPSAEEIAGCTQDFMLLCLRLSTGPVGIYWATPSGKAETRGCITPATLGWPQPIVLTSSMTFVCSKARSRGGRGQR